MLHKGTMPPRYISVAFMLFMLSGLAAPQNLPDSPGVTVGLFPSAALAAGVVTMPPPAALGPWINPTVADAPYWSSTAALFATTLANVELTTRCSEQHTCLTQIAPGSTRLTLYAYTLPTDLLVSYLSYKLKGKTHFWIVPQVLLTGANLFSAGRSYGRIR
jgi:hypothetical protein